MTAAKYTQIAGRGVTVSSLGGAETISHTLSISERRYIHLQ